MHDTLKDRYKIGILTKGQLKKYVQLKVITEEAYKDIVGDDYIA